MAASLAKLCLAAALAQQVLAASDLPFMPSVGIAAYQGCVGATALIHEDKAIEDVHGAPCDKLDAARLKDLGVDDCVGTLKDATSLIMTTECLFGTAMDESMQDKCLLPKKGRKLKGCKQRLDMVMADFTSEPIEVLDPAAPEEMLDSFETVLGVFATCRSAVLSSEDEYPKLAEEIGGEIDGFCRRETDAKSMNVMGLTRGNCREDIAEPLMSFVTAACTYYVLGEVDDPSAMCAKDVAEKVGDFADHLAEIVAELQQDGAAAMHQGDAARALLQDPLGKRLLRLHSLVGSEKDFGKSLGEALRKSASWSLASVALAAAASASALAALGLLAWRRHLAKGRPGDIEPILCAQDTQE